MRRGQPWTVQGLLIQPHQQDRIMSKAFRGLHGSRPQRPTKSPEATSMDLQAFQAASIHRREVSLWQDRSWAWARQVSPFQARQTSAAFTSISSVKQLAFLRQ